VLAASNGIEALRICEQHEGPIHLVLTDVIMPTMSGKDLADRLVAKYPHLRVLYMSGYTDEAIFHRGVLKSGTQFIAKPFTPADLTRLVRQVLDDETQTQETGDDSSRQGAG